MEEYAEPSILEYARFHGVASSNLVSSQLLDYISVNTLENLQLTPDAKDDELEARLSTAASTANSKQNERLEIDRDGAVFLSSIIKPTAPSLPEYTESANRHRVKEMKLDTPVLQSDHELDMRAFTDGIVSVDLAKLDLPPEAIVDENDEGLGWPGYFKDFPAQMWERARTEKLDCTREVLLFIQEIRDVSWDGVAGGQVGRVKKQTAIEPLTPPLLPLDPESSPFVPLSPAGRLEILSDPETPPVKEHVVCEQKVLGMDSIEADDGEASEQVLVDYLGVGDQDSKLYNEVKESPVQKRTRGVELKVEGPITPPISARKRRLEEESNSASEILADNGPKLLRQPDVKEHPDGEILDEYLIEIARAAMDKVEAKLNSERLRQVDPTVRAQVPVLPATAIIPPWKATGLWPKDENQKFISSMLEEYLGGTYCPMKAKVERSLEWAPFSLQKSTVNVEERIEDDGGFQYAQLPDQPDCGATDSLRGKLCALQILKDDDGPGGEELMTPDIIPETLSGSSSTMLEASVSNRMEVTGQDSARPPREERKTNLHQKKSTDSLDKKVRKLKRPTLPAARPKFSLFQSSFSTLNSVSNFMEVQGQGTKRRKLESSPYFSTSEEPVQPDELALKQSDEAVVNPSPSTIVESFPDIPLPFPEIAPPPESLTLVLSTSLLKSHRFVVRHLESMEAEHKLIFRDYSQFSQTSKKRQEKHMRQIVYTSPASGPAVEEDENLAQEADIIISPNTGILLTTSQATTQLYLPGQSPRNIRGGTFDSPLRERIARTCVRYEQLYVLICQPSETYSRTNPSLTPGSDLPPMRIDSRTVDSIRSLISFCASLSLVASVTPLVVPSQSPELMKWIIGLANKHALPSVQGQDQHQQEEEETTHELFLRRAGLNPFAAHYVLTSLQAQGGYRNSSLAAFINMDSRKRRGRFAPILGEKLFARVERRLEMRWDFV